VPRRITAFLVILSTISVVAVGGIFATLSFLSQAAAPAASSSAVKHCPAASPVTVGTIVVPAGPVAGYCQSELINAAHIMNAARDLGLGTHTQAVGIMTAMGESGLVNLDHGDAAGADSRGLFQQRDNGAWGTLADRMDPYTAAANFFNALTRISGWDSLTPTQAAHSVQINADPNYYATYWADAQTVVAALTGS
jgi:hypothetical protein